MEQVALVLEGYARRYNPEQLFGIEEEGALEEEARAFLFSDTSLLDKTELQTVLNHLMSKFDQEFVSYIPRMIPQDFPHELSAPAYMQVREHCMAMFPKMQDFLREDHLEKLLRWIGFVSGSSIFLHENLRAPDFFGIRMSRILEYRHYYFAENRFDLAMAFLGTVQGLLWSAGAYSLEELKTHNRP